MAVLAPVRLPDEPDHETAVDRPSSLLPLTVLTVSFALSSVLETGENERFRFELGTLPLMGGIVVLVAICRAVAGRWGARHLEPMAPDPG